MSDLNEYNNQETPVNTQAEEQPAVNMTDTGIAAEPQSPADMGPEIVSGTEPVKKKHKALWQQQRRLLSLPEAAQRLTDSFRL